MDALPIVEAFDPVDDIEFGLSARFVANPMDAFNFQSLEEAFDGGVVPAIGSPAHRLNHLVVLDQFSVIGAGVLATPIRVHDQSRSWFS